MISSSALDCRTGFGLQWSLDYWRWRAERDHARSWQIPVIKGPRLPAANWKGIRGASDEGPLLSRQQAAALLGVSVKTLDRLKLPCVRIGRRVLYRRADLQAYVESAVIVPPAPRSPRYAKMKSATARPRAKVDLEFKDWLTRAKAEATRKKSD
jgi:excisionase family DNA binding protein